MFDLSRKTRKPVKIFSKKEKLEESETKTTPCLYFLPTISSLLPKKIFIPPEAQIKRQNSKKIAFLLIVY